MAEAQHEREVELGGENGWRAVVADGLDRLGWTDHTRIERPAEDVTLLVVDAPLERDVVIALQGPTTFSLSIILEGSGTVSVDGLPPLPVSPGTAVLFATGGFASGVNTLRGGQRFHVVDIRFDESFLIRASGSALGPSGTALMQAAEPGSTAVFLSGFPASRPLLQIVTEIAEAPAGDTLAKRLVLQGKAIVALGSALELLDRSVSAAKPLRPQDRAKIEQARLAIEQNFDQDWTIARLAREVGLAEKQLKSGFRDVTGSPVHAYLTATRLDAAARHLEGGMSVTDAALAVGFGNLSHFSKMFREAKGVSPSLYARRR